MKSWRKFLKFMLLSSFILLGWVLASEEGREEFVRRVLTDWDLENAEG